jgi:hypothetical protein
LQSLLRVDHFGEEQIVGRPPPVHENPRLVRALARRHAESLQRGVREVGVVGRDDDVGGQAHVRAAADTVAVHLGDGGLGEIPQVQRRLDEQIRLRFPRVLRSHGTFDERRVVDGVVADRVARAEALAVRLQTQNFDVVVAIGVQQSCVHLLGQLLVLGVGFLGQLSVMRAIGPSLS